MDELKTLATKSLTTIIDQVASVLPNIVGAIVALLIGWIIIKIVLFILKKILKVAKIEKVSQRINDAGLFGDDSKIKIDISKILLGFVKWLFMLVFIIVAADIIGLSIISTEIANLLRYLPILLSAMVIFMIGMFAARMIKKALVSVFDSMGMGGSKIIGNVIFYIIAIFVTITALNQAGIDTTIITSNFTIILGAFLLAMALGFGLGSREIVGDLLRSFYARKNYAVGDKIKIDDIKGTIESIDNMTMTLDTKEGKIVLPIKEVAESRVKIG